MKYFYFSKENNIISIRIPIIETGWIENVFLVVDIPGKNNFPIHCDFFKRFLDKNNQYISVFSASYEVKDDTYLQGFYSITYNVWEEAKLVHYEKGKEEFICFRTYSFDEFYFPMCEIAIPSETRFKNAQLVIHLDGKEKPLFLPCHYTKNIPHLTDKKRFLYYYSVFYLIKDPSYLKGSYYLSCNFEENGKLIHYDGSSNYQKFNIDPLDLRDW